MMVVIVEVVEMVVMVEVVLKVLVMVMMMTATICRINPKYAPGKDVRRLAFVL